MSAHVDDLNDWLATLTLRDCNDQQQNSILFSDAAAMVGSYYYLHSLVLNLTLTHYYMLLAIII